VAKIKTGSFTVELVFYLFLSLLLTQYLFRWLDTLIINVKRMSFQIHCISSLMVAHIKFLQTVNNAPCHDNLWLVRNDTRCCWKDLQGTVCLYYKNGLLVQKTYSNEHGTTTRLILLSKLCAGSFHYSLKNNLIEHVTFSCRFNNEEKRFSLFAKTRCEQS
jgi:hypothetical protein